jgi:hypothetical protein
MLLEKFAMTEGLLERRTMGWLSTVMKNPNTANIIRKASQARKDNTVVNKREFPEIRRTFSKIRTRFPEGQKVSLKEFMRWVKD